MLTTGKPPIMPNTWYAPSLCIGLTPLNMDAHHQRNWQHCTPLRSTEHDAVRAGCGGAEATRWLDGIYKFPSTIINAH